MMKSKLLVAGMLGGIVFAGAGCAQDKVADNTQQGTYSHARHIQVGSNIPQPNRGGGTMDKAQADLEREQYMQQSQMANLGSGPGLGGPH